MAHGLFHRQPLRAWLLASDDDIDVVAAAQTVIGNGQQRVGIRRQIDTHDFRLLVDDVIDEARILVAEAVVVLAPDMGTQEIVQRPDGPAPGDLVADLQPLGMLVEHGIDDVDERLVAREEAMAAGQEITFEPALALVFTEHLHDASIR